MNLKNSAYLDIYKNDGKIIIKLAENIFSGDNFKNFLNYIFELREKSINFILLDINGKEIFSNKGTNYFDDEQKNITKSINNILILDENYYIEDIEKNHINFISHENLKKIINQEYNQIKIKENTQLFKKLLEIDKLLDNGNSKVTLTNLGGVKEEIEGFGSGTMFINLQKAKSKQLNNLDLFKQIYKKYNDDGNWKKREEEEIKIISNNYNVLELDGTILGGYYLGNYEIELNGVLEKGKLLENLFSSKSGGGIGKVLGEEIKNDGGIIFAYSKQETFFKNLGFKKIDGEKSKSGADLWMFKKS